MQFYRIRKKNLFETLSHQHFFSSNTINKKFFDSKGKLIPWQFGLRLPVNQLFFSYDGSPEISGNEIWYSRRNC